MVNHIRRKRRRWRVFYLNFRGRCRYLTDNNRRTGLKDICETPRRIVAAGKHNGNGYRNRNKYRYAYGRRPVQKNGSVDNYNTIRPDILRRLRYWINENTG